MSQKCIGLIQTYFKDKTIYNYNYKMRQIIQPESNNAIDVNNDVREFLTLRFEQAGRRGNKTLQVYSNQLDIAREILKCFNENRKIVNISVIAHTQSGKTGTMLAILKLIVLELNIVPIENIYIVTGLSSIDWKKQTQNNFPIEMHDQIFHLNDLMKKFDEIKTKKNVLIMMDEVQLAAKPGQTIDKCFKDFGIEKLYENDIKIVEFSATPDGTLYDLHESKWEDSSKIILAKPGSSYFGSFDYLEQGRVRQYKDLCGYDDTTGFTDPVALENIRELEEFVNGFSTPKYHIIRTKTAQYGDATRDNFRGVFGVNCSYRTYDGERIDIEKINDLLSVQPFMHTFIFVKQLLRCSNDLKTKTHIGIMYELFTKGGPNNSVVSQSLLGRATGYNVPAHILVWTDIKTIGKYKALWDAGFSKDALIEWKSATTKTSGGQTSSKGTFNGTIVNDPIRPSTIDQDNFERNHEIRNTQYEIEIIGKSIGKCNHITYKSDINGFKKCSISGTPCVQSLASVLNLIKPDCKKLSNMPITKEELLPNIGDTTQRRYVCYENILDISTECFVIIWAKRIKNTLLHS